MRCPDCNKFVSYDDSAEPELDLTPPEAGGSDVTGTVRIVLTCAECGAELKECTFDISDDLSTEIPDGWQIADGAEITDESSELTSRTQTGTDKVVKRGPNKGKTVRVSWKSRYWRTFYGASVSYTLTATLRSVDPKNTETKSISLARDWSDEVPAGGMDELV